MRVLLAVSTNFTDNPRISAILWMHWRILHTHAHKIKGLATEILDVMILGKKKTGKYDYHKTFVIYRYVSAGLFNGL